MKYKDNTNKWNKPLAILLCLGVFAGLNSLRHSNQQKTEEFIKDVAPSMSSMFTGKNSELFGGLGQFNENYIKAYVEHLPADLVSRGERLRWFKLIFKLKPETCKTFIRFSDPNFDKYSNSIKSLLIQYCDNSYWGVFYF